MSPGGRVAGIGMIACTALAGGVPAAGANEIWVAPTVQADVGGLGIGSNGVWPVTAVGAARLVWGVPGDLETFTSARLVLIPHAPGGAGTLTLYVCAAGSGDMAAAACTGPHTQPFTGVANQLLEVDVSAAIAPQVGPAGTNHLAVLAYTTPTTTTDHIVGLRFAYDPLPPAGAATLGANTFTGPQTAPAFVGDGSGLTNVPLPAGAATLGANTFSGTQTAPAFVGNGSGLTNLPFPAGAATLGVNTFTGTQTINGGNLDLDQSTSTAGNVMKDGTRFLHTVGGETNVFLGVSAGNLDVSTTSLPVQNTGLGHMALTNIRFGHSNTAVGAYALRDTNSTGLGGVYNTAVGTNVMKLNTAGSQNTALGANALGGNTFGIDNTAIGFATMGRNTTGEGNTTLGMNGLTSLRDGSFNLGIGFQAGMGLETGSNNVYVDNRGTAVESDTMRLGDTQTKTFIAGIRGATPGIADAVPVVIDSAGQLGTVSPGGIASLVANTFGATQTVDGGNVDLDPSTALAGNLTKNGTRFLHDFGLANTFLGANAGNFTMASSADGNTAVGASTLRSVTTGSANTAIGVNALFANTSGVGNTAIGASALLDNTSGGGNTSTGGNSLAENTEGFENTASGHSSLRLNTTGAGNTGVGVSALHSNLAGNSNTAIGRHALRNTTGHNNAALGFSAGLNATTGSNNIYLGTNVAGEAGESNTMYLGRVGTQTKTVIAGVRGATVTGGEMVLVDADGRLGSAPVATGANTVGTGEVIDDSLSAADLAPNSIGTSEVAFNYAASGSEGGPASDLACVACVGPGEVSFGFASPGPNTFTGTQEIDAGNIDFEPSSATSGNLTKNGFRFLHDFGLANTFLGILAGNFTTTGEGNTGVGRNALRLNDSGDHNTATGTLALEFNTSGTFNAAFGRESLRNNATGLANTAVGFQALRDNVAGEANTAAGADALEKATGTNNTAFGYAAGFSATTGSNNIYLGANVFGVAGESNAMYLGRVGTQTKTFIAGVRGIATVNPDAIQVVIDSAGQLGTISSSRRFKEDIRDMGEASAPLLQLRPVTFRYTQPFAGGVKPIQYGLIAEEVAEVLPGLVVTGADGQIQTVQYHKLDAMFINELQKLYREVRALKAEVARLKGEPRP